MTLIETPQHELARAERSVQHYLALLAGDGLTAEEEAFFCRYLVAVLKKRQAIVETLTDRGGANEHPRL